MPAFAGLDPLANASAAALLRSLGSFHPDTLAHSRAVVETAHRVAAELDVEPRRLGEIELAALLHDVGKIGVPRELLDKPDALSESELAEVRRHTELGERLIRAMPGLWHLAPSIRACHERWDGLGYPDGLQGEQIPLVSRIVFVCDAFDAMTSDRPYREAMPKSVAVREVATNAGAQFCPTSAEALIKVVSGPFRLLGKRTGAALD